MSTLNDSFLADLSLANASKADADAYAAADAARTSAKARADASAASATGSHQAVNAQAAEGVLYALPSGVFAIKIDGDVKYLSPTDPATVVLPDPTPAPETPTVA